MAELPCSICNKPIGDAESRPETRGSGIYHLRCLIGCPDGHYIFQDLGEAVPCSAEPPMSTQDVSQKLFVRAAGTRV